MTRWISKPLKYSLVRNDSGVWGDDASGDDDTVVLRSTDITLNGDWRVEEPAKRRLTAQERIQSLLSPGDLVVVKSSGSPAHLGKTALVTGEIATMRPSFANFVQRLRPGPGADSRYLWYLLNSTYASIQIDVLGTTTTGLRNLNGGVLGSLRCPDAPLAAQRAIADYLDAETARIDSLIEKKRRMVELLGTQREAFIEYVIWTDVSGAGPLKHRTDQSRPIMYGIVLPGPSVSDGVPIVKGGDVAARRLSPELLNRTTPAIEAPYARARLAPNDLVFAIRGGVGDVEIVPPELAGANITQDVARVSCADNVRAHWLHFVLQTARVKQQVEARTTGATIRGLNIWELKRIQVPMSNLERQGSDLDRLQPMAERNDAIGSALASQIDLLVERRQALITAAVTGELPIPGVAA